MSKWLTIAGVALLILAGVSLNNRNPTNPAAAPPSVVPFHFVPVKGNLPQVNPKRDVVETSRYDAAYAAAYAKVALEGKKITWSSPQGVPLIVVLNCYGDFAGKSVFVGDDIRGAEVGAFNFSALTTSGLTRDFEERMQSSRIVFVRDRTNAVWVMHATNELTFRQNFGLAR